MNEYTEFDTAAEMQKALDRKKAAYGVPYAPLLETTVVNQDGIIEDAFKGNAIEMISTCCGAQDRPTSIDGPSYEDVGYCPECGDHTEFITVCDECSESPCQCHTARSRADRDPVNSLISTMALGWVITLLCGVAIGYYIGAAEASAMVLEAVK